MVKFSQILHSSCIKEVLFFLGDTAFTLAAKSNSEKVESLLGKTLLDQRATVAQNDNQYGPVTS